MKRNTIPDIKEKIFFQNYENLFNVYDIDGEYYYNILRKINIPTDISTDYYSEYLVKPGDTWTLLAYTFYDDVRLWWIICYGNNIQNPLGFPEIGTKLKMLNNDIVQTILMQIKGT